MDRRVTPPKRVTSPTWGPSPPCKQALEFSSFLGIYTGTLICIVKLADEVCASHTKHVVDNKTILLLKKLTKVLLTGSAF